MENPAQSLARPACPVCREAIDTGRAHLCGSCDTPHHADCWSFNRGCAIFGCRPPARALAARSSRTPPVTGVERTVAEIALGWLLVVAMVGFGPMRRLMEVASDRVALHVERQIGRGL